MGSNLDDLKGRAKEAAGDLGDNDDLKREGQRDQMGAEVKDKAERAQDKVSDAVDNIKDKFDNNR